MNNKRFKIIGWASHNHFITLNKTNNMNTSVGMVLHLFCKPVTTGFNEFALVQTCALFYPTISLGNYLNIIDQILTSPFCCSIPLNVLFAMFNINRTWFPIHSKATPIPKFKRENIGSGANLEHHAVFSRTVNSTGRYQHMVMLFHRPGLYILFGFK